MLYNLLTIVSSEERQEAGGRRQEAGREEGRRICSDLRSSGCAASGSVLKKQ
ncbi:MAG: hypothetical protein F6K21_04630 [Symploca sp. SIO2D2]|nr:hypothetical protein [Symploca sp. SIO2D2]